VKRKLSARFQPEDSPNNKFVFPTARSHASARWRNKQRGHRRFNLLPLVKTAYEHETTAFLIRGSKRRQKPQIFRAVRNLKKCLRHQRAPVAGFIALHFQSVE
jgi:hypothetical protein